MNEARAKELTERWRTDLAYTAPEAEEWRWRLIADELVDEFDGAVVLDPHERDLIRSALGRWRNEGVRELLAKL